VPRARLNDFGRLLVALRGVSGKALSHALGIPAFAVSRMLHGRCGIPPDRLAGLSVLLRCPPELLVEPSISAARLEQILLRSARHLSQTDQRLAFRKQDQLGRSGSSADHRLVNGTTATAATGDVDRL
jgi:hypothetical protein